MSRRNNTAIAHASTLHFMAGFENKQMALIRPFITREIYVALAPHALPFPTRVSVQKGHGHVINVRLNAAQCAEFARQLKTSITEYPWVTGEIFSQGNSWFRIYGHDEVGALRILAALVMRAQFREPTQIVLPPIVAQRYAIVIPPKHEWHARPTNRARQAAANVVSLGGFRAAKSADLTERIRALMP